MDRKMTLKFDLFDQNLVEQSLYNFLSWISFCYVHLALLELQTECHCSCLNIIVVQNSKPCVHTHFVRSKITKHHSLAYHITSVDKIRINFIQNTFSHSIYMHENL